LQNCLYNRSARACTFIKACCYHAEGKEGENGQQGQQGQQGQGNGGADGMQSSPLAGQLILTTGMLGIVALIANWTRRPDTQASSLFSPSATRVSPCTPPPVAGRCVLNSAPEC
jgi:hypothetical protein